MSGPPTRRALLRLLASMSLALPGLGRARGQPSDRGIGGTGYAPGDDRGIGGTGVIGTIQKFGSIVVNDLRIAYPPDVEVRIDGRPGTITDLKIGQVVRVAARGSEDSYSTRVIDVTSEVVGPVESVAGKSLVVLGQAVSTEGMHTTAFAIGDVVAVSGLRRNDGTIVASLVEPRPGAPSRVAGPITLGAGGTPTIGNLSLANAPFGLVGRRVIVEGTAIGGDRFSVSRGVAESSLLPPGVRTLSLESYVERRGDGVNLGSGFRVGGGQALGYSAQGSVRAVITATVERNGRLTVDSVHAGGRTYGVPSVGSRDAGSRNGMGAGRDGRNRVPENHGASGKAPGAGRGVNKGHNGRMRDGEMPGGGREPFGGRESGPTDFGRDGRGPHEPGGGFGQGGGGRFGRGGFGGGGRRRR